MDSFENANKELEEAFAIIADALSRRKELADSSEEKQKKADLDFLKSFKLKQTQGVKERFYDVKNTTLLTLEKISE